MAHHRSEIPSCEMLNGISEGQYVIKGWSDRIRAGELVCSCIFEMLILLVKVYIAGAILWAMAKAFIF